MSNATDFKETWGYSVCYGIIIPTVSFAGVICNVLNLLVMFHPQLSESCYTYLTSLAVADLSTLLVFGFNGIGRGFFPREEGWRNFEAYVYMPFGFFTTTVSVVLTVAVTIERYILLFHPYRSKTWCNQKTARRVVIVITVVSLVYNIPRSFVFKVVNGAMVYTDFGKSLFNSILSWFHLIVVSLGSCLSLIVLNCFLIVGLKRVHKKHGELASTTSQRVRKHEKEQQRITLMLIAVIFVFIIGELPSALMSRMLIIGIFGVNSNILSDPGYNTGLLVATILVTLQHSLNFIFYFMFNIKFHCIFKHIICCSRGKIQDINIVQSHSQISQSNHAVNHLSTVFPNNGGRNQVSQQQNHVFIECQSNTELAKNQRTHPHQVTNTLATQPEITNAIHEGQSAAEVHQTVNKEQTETANVSTVLHTETVSQDQKIQNSGQSGAEKAIKTLQ